MDRSDKDAPVTRRDAARTAMGSMLVAGLAGPSAPIMAAQGAGPAVDGAVTPLAFGAMCDGRHDDTAAIRAAVARCVATGRNLYLPAGTYLITGSIVVDTATGFTIFGEGYGSCIRPRPGGDYVPLLVQRTRFARIEGMHLCNFRIDANGTGQLDTGVVTFNNAVGSITGMWLENGTRRRGSSGQNGISCSAGDVGGAGPEVVLTRNVIRNFSKAGINFTSGGASAVITANLITDIAGNGTAPAIQVNGGRNAIVAHNHVTRIEGAGIYIATDKLDHPSFSANIAHNIIEYCGQGSPTQGDGILVTSSSPSDSYIVIEGNQAFNNGKRTNGGCGIRIENCDNAVISGNSCHHNSFDGIRIDNASYVQLVGNRCGDNNVAGVEYAGGIQLCGKGAHINVTGNHLSSKGPSQSYAIIADAAADLSFVTIAGNHVVGNSRGTIYWQAQGAGLDIDVAVRQRTAGRDPMAILLWRIDRTVACRISLTAVGRRAGGGPPVILDEEALYWTEGGQVRQQAMAQSRDPAIGRPGWGGVAFSSSREFAVVQVSGAADAAVEWTGSARIRSV